MLKKVTGQPGVEISASPLNGSAHCVPCSTTVTKIAIHLQICERKSDRRLTVWRNAQSNILQINKSKYQLVIYAQSFWFGWHRPGNPTRIKLSGKQISKISFVFRFWFLFASKIISLTGLINKLIFLLKTDKNIFLIYFTYIFIFNKK